MNNNNYTKKIYDKESNSWRYYNDENQLHRLDGYAIESDDPEYYINGEEIYNNKNKICLFDSIFYLLFYLEQKLLILNLS